MFVYINNITLTDLGYLNLNIHHLCMVIILENKIFFLFLHWEFGMENIKERKKGINGNLITYTGFPFVL